MAPNEQCAAGSFDRTNRALTVDDEDAGTTADTTYTYSRGHRAETIH
jgi:hypothetical protein